MSAQQEQGCKVCGRPSTDLRYNRVTCNACHVFIFRHAEFPPTEKCKYNNNPDRGQCTSCRFRRCCEVMSKSAVGRRLKPPMACFIIYMDPVFIRWKMLQLHSTLYSSPLHWGPEVAQGMMNLPKFSMDENGQDSNMAMENLDITLADLIATCTAEHQSSLEQTTQDTTDKKTDIQSHLSQSFCRMAVSFVDFMCLNRHFHQMPDEDKEKIVRANFPLFPTWIFLKKKLKDKTEKHLTFFEKFGHMEEIRPLIEKTDSALLWLQESALSLHEDIQIDDTETMFLNVMSCFNPPPNLSLEGQKAAIKLREEFTISLSNYIFCKNPTQTAWEHFYRVKKLLALTRQVQEVADVIHCLYSAATACKCSDMTGTLAYDMFIRSY